MPRILILSERGRGRGTSSKVIEKLGGALASDMGRRWVLLELKLTRLERPHWDIDVRSDVIDSEIFRWEADLAIEEGALGKEVEECRVESSA
jgi:hypothetical protein